MGKRKKSSRKPAAPRAKDPLDSTFTCLFCHHDKSVTVRIDRKEGVASLACKICDQRYQSKVNHLTEAVDIYSEWIDAAESAQKDDAPRRPAASSSRPQPTRAASAYDSDDD
ncbi:Elf1-domain-containing protein [Coprinopsis marcescibilis]|uniref:Transcription elongation factor 1 homolog n=1 Tax=Coprinopsis marcescibilis TaxID=230819 RepID=A0A5C3LDG6_COPMA|nr:Elf1-domain-containing protein [Coprinopsis marcescibilis]